VNLKVETLKADHKDQAIKVAAWVGNDPKRFQNVVSMMVGKDANLAKRAAWVFSHSVDAYPYLVKPHIKPIIKNLYKTKEDAVKRASVRNLQFIEIPEQLWGETVEITFNLLQSNSEPIAVKVFAMTLLYNLSNAIPEIKKELKISIEDQLPVSSTGFQNRGNKILAKLNREIE
jgi:hypothetical protein